MASRLGAPQAGRLSSGYHLWQDPPWAAVKPGGGYQMGLAPVAITQWLPRLASAAEAERKAGLMRLQHLPEPVYQSLPTSAAAERQAANYVMAHLSRQQRNKATTALRQRPDLAPLSEAALQVPDDLCVLQLNPKTQQFYLVAASLCSPSYWRLSAKLGLPLSAIHEPVPGLNRQLGERMQSLFLQLPQRRCFVRRNIFVHAQQDLYQPTPDAVDYAGVSVAELMLRSERQSLMRISADLMLFTIRVDLAPLADAGSWPAQAEALHRMLTALSSTQRQAFGSSTKLAAVVRFLAGVTRARVEHPP